MKTVYIFLAAIMAALPAEGADFGTLKPGAAPAPLWAVHASTASPQRAPEKAARRADFQGIVLTSDAQPAAAPYICSFRAGYSPTPVKIMELTRFSSAAGTAAGAEVKYMSYVTTSSGSISAVDWVTANTESATITSSISQNYALGVCMDMTYDRSTGTIYGISAVVDALVTIDATTGAAIQVAETLPFYTLSADLGGQLYGIALNSTTGEGDLYTVNKLTGAAVRVGATGVKMLTNEARTAAYFQTAAFSAADGMLYWCVVNSDNVSALYRIDPATARASYLAPMPGNEMFVALFDFDPAAEPGAPGIVTNATATASASDITINFKAPAATASGGALAELDAVDIYRGSGTEPIHTVSPVAAGAACSWVDASPSPGINAYRLVARNSTGESLPVYASAFFGEDFPTAPTDVAVALGADGYPEVTWTAPATGVNGLPLDPAKLTYKILRNDGSGATTTVAEAVSALSYTDRTLNLSRQCYPYYFVVAVSSGGEGLQSQPAGTYAGPDYKLPFTETFRDCTLSSAPWILQSLDLGGTWELNYISTFPGSGPYCDGGMLVFIGFRAVEGAQARIATPRLDFSEAASPELRFHFYYLDMSSQDLYFDDRMVVETSVDGAPFEAVPGGTFYQHDADTRWTDVAVPLRHLAGKQHVALAFHGISAGGFDLLVDNVRVVDNPAGITDASTEAADGPVSYYDLQGRPVAAPFTPGLYLRRQGNRTEKIYISNR